MTIDDIPIILLKFHTQITKNDPTTRCNFQWWLQTNNSMSTIKISQKFHPNLFRSRFFHKNIFSLGNLMMGWKKGLNGPIIPT